MSKMKWTHDYTVLCVCGHKAAIALSVAWTLSCYHTGLLQSNELAPLERLPVLKLRSLHSININIKMEERKEWKEK